ncbi:LysR family transcriptional regulator [Tropicimonas sp. IMCC6043]|uniref:LysR family transcriptional regulator n=1 Tax=Tropicimonas sp. IMCC6043 TaxID=2510645 RepID=UPI00101CABE6|nr:LysR family transcriptional regulator [Tropicimonas sp. IMCC6043]RYH11351.1 LysR family transcriptional regulator [Tropicimonas sp. IMCC6043]
MLSLRQIETVRAVLLSGSITGAARMLNVSPPSVSRMLKHSESLVGMSFFDRTANGFVPRPEIAELLTDLEAVHDGILRVNRRLEAAQRPIGGKLAIGTSPGLGVSLVPRAIKAMYRELPDVELTFDVLHRDEFASQLLLQNVDLAMAIFDVDDPRIDSVPIDAGRLVCLVPADHRLAHRDVIALADLQTEDIIGFNQSQFQQAMIERLLEQAGVRLRPFLRVRLTVSAYFMVANGAGVALLDSFTVGEAPSDRVKVIPLKEQAGFTLRLFHSRHTPLSQIAELFIRHIRACLTSDPFGEI